MPGANDSSTAEVLTVKIPVVKSSVAQVGNGAKSRVLKSSPNSKLSSKSLVAVWPL